MYAIEYGNIGYVKNVNAVMVKFSDKPKLFNNKAECSVFIEKYADAGLGFASKYIKVVEMN